MLANIKKTFSPMPILLSNAREGAQAGWNVFLVGLLALAVGLGSVFSEMIPLIPYIIVKIIIGLNAPEGYTFDMNGEDLIIVQLFAKAAPIIVLMLYVKFAEKRSIRTMGFVREHAVTDYLIGMVTAFAMFSACVGICVATGSMTFEGSTLDGKYLTLALIFVGFIIQGASEETVCRGFMMTSFGSKGGAVAGMLLNSLLFGALHLLNSGVTVLSILNVILFGVFMSVLVLKLNSIWMACAIHTVWNFVQGNFFGILVSGNQFGPSVFRFESVSGKELFNGGGFGMEGGLVTSVILALAIVIVLLMKPRQPKEAANG